MTSAGTLGGADRPDPFTEFTGDPEAARLLRSNLTAIAEQHAGTAMAQLVRDVLSGRREIRDLEHDREFMALTRSGVQQYEDYWDSLSDEERQQLTREAEARLDELEGP
ncbi:hypothetical protein [Nocardioides sp. LHG3406-4]|uniref:hypothetical protein n=1 Tax=Nocardioides sp. LHG3406-4 TaxID=2804575 RepID=UPI003CEEDFD4